jgi:hypothetical protein
MDTTPDDDDRHDEQLTIKNVISAGSNNNRCVVCRRTTTAGVVVMPKPARLDLLIRHRMYAAHGVRCCSSHLLNGNRLMPNVVVNMDNRQLLATSLSSADMTELLDDLLILLQEAITSPHLDFLDPCLTDEDYSAWTGWTKMQFDAMLEEVVPFLRSSCNRDRRNAFGMFWIKLKTNLSFRQIGSLFNVPGDGEARRKRAADAFDSVRQSLAEHFVPKHLGVGYLSRNEAKRHNTSFSKEFYGDKVTIIWDGTYIYIGKSSAHQVRTIIAVSKL